MRTSRMRLAALVALGGIVLSGCGSAKAETAPAVAPAVAPVPGVVALQGVDGTIAVGTEVVGTGRIVDGGAVAVVARTDGGSTEVQWRSTTDATVLAAIQVEGELELAAADENGRSVALVTAGAEAGQHAIAAGRAESEIVVVDREGEQFRQRYDGNLVPEGFANWYAEGFPTLPGAAYVLEFTPPGSPTHYRVRTIDLPSGRLGLPLNLRDKTQTVDQLMAGVSRTQLLATRRGLLFTLYRGHHDEGHGSYAFVHTLGLANGVWCLVVPDEMELADRGGALALTPNGEELVAVSANGMIAKIPLVNITTPDLAPTFEVPIDLGSSTDGVPAMATGRDRLWVGLGRTLVRVDPTSLVPTAAVEVPVTIEAIAERADGTVVVGGEGRLLSLNDDLAVTLDVGAPEGVGPLRAVVTDRRSE